MRDAALRRLPAGPGGRASEMRGGGGWVRFAWKPLQLKPRGVMGSRSLYHGHQLGAAHLDERRAPGTGQSGIHVTQSHCS